MESLSRRAYGAIKRAVMDRQIAVGATYSQSELAGIVHFSTNPVREALKLLEHEGFLEIKARSGIRIIKPDLKYIAEVHQLRRILELASIDFFVAGASRSELEDLRRAHLSLREKALSDAALMTYMEAHASLEEELHFGILAALENETVLRLYKVNYDKMRIVRMDRAGYTSRHIVETMDEHLAILDAVIANDTAAARTAVDRHLTRALERSVIGAGPAVN
jgi:DNA-binding GntR family transcriptional regulator